MCVCVVTCVALAFAVAAGPAVHVCAREFLL